MRDRSVPLAIMLAGLAGCQSMPEDAPAASSEVVSVYASPFDAATVAAWLWLDAASGHWVAASRSRLLADATGTAPKRPAATVAASKGDA